VRALCQEIGGSEQSVDFVGVAAAGQIEQETGVVRFAPNLGWTDAPLGPRLSELLGIRVVVDNDVRAATVGEYLFGLPAPTRSFYNVYVGTGVGSGFIADGRLLRGHSNSACEIGHHSIRYDGPRCTCGNYGCLELYASGTGLARRAREAVQANKNTRLWTLAGGDLERIDSHIVSQAAKENDALALSLIRETGQILGIALSNIVNLFNPEVLMIGGGLIGLGDEFVMEAHKSFRDTGLKWAVEHTRFEVSRLGVKASIIGASFLGMLDPLGRIVV